jgi:hypothetical protein
VVAATVLSWCSGGCDIWCGVVVGGGFWLVVCYVDVGGVATYFGFGGGFDSVVR